VTRARISHSILAKILSSEEKALPCRISFLCFHKLYIAAPKLKMHNLLHKLSFLSSTIHYFSMSSQDLFGKITKQRDKRFFQIRKLNPHSKNKCSLDSKQPRQKGQRQSPIKPHLHILLLVIIASLKTSHNIKACLGMATECQTIFHH
jgi:hypothetical protein